MQRLGHEGREYVMWQLTPVGWQYDLMTLWQFAVVRQHGSQRRLSTMWVTDDAAVSAIGYGRYSIKSSMLEGSKEGKWREANKLWFITSHTLWVSHTMGLPWCFLLPRLNPTRPPEIHQRWHCVAYIPCWRVGGGQMGWGVHWQWVWVWKNLKETKHISFTVSFCIFWARSDVMGNVES